MRKIALLSGLMALAATPALAHPGHAVSGLAAGFAHPFSGLDHLLVMVAVGLWGGLALGRGKALWPAAFVAFMLAGYGLGLGGAALPGAEAVIIGSVVALGLAIGLNLKPPAALGAAVVGAFAVAHGYAHGLEAPAGAASAGFAAGFAAATVTLHAVGLGLAWAVGRSSGVGVARMAGFGMAATGVALAFI